MSLRSLCFCLLFVTACGQATPTMLITPTPPPPLVYFIETATPTPTSTPIRPTATATPLPPTATATELPSTATPTLTAAPPTATRPRPTATFTPRSPTATPLPSATATPSTPVAETQAKTPVALSEGLNPDEERMLSLLNAERAKRGIPLLANDPIFQTVSRMRAADMFARGFFSHNDPRTGERVAKAMLLKLGLDVSSGENFAWRRPYDPQVVEQIMRWFMSDPPHRDNIIATRWNVVGVAVLRGPNDTVVAVQNFGVR